MRTKIMICTMVFLLSAFTGSAFGEMEGIYNTYFGNGAGNNTLPDNVFYDTFIGAWAGTSNTEGQYNTYVGYNAGATNSTGIANTFIGYAAGQNGNGSGNTLVGSEAGLNCWGWRNVMVGEFAGLNNHGWNSVFIGWNAGANEGASNRLYIDNAFSPTPFIYGEFDNRLLKIDGTLLLGEYATPAKGVRALNMIGDRGGMRLWRVHPEYPPTMEFLNSKPDNPDTILSYWDIYAGTQYGPSMFFIRDRYPAGAGNLNRMTIGDNGYVGFGTGNSAPVYPLEFGAQANGAYLSAAGYWTDGSSRDYKENIRLLSAETALDTIKNLEPVTFDSKADPTEKHVGFIAEDVPDLVATKDRKHLSPMDIVAVLTKVVQEQQNAISLLREELDKLKGK